MEVLQVGLAYKYQVSFHMKVPKLLWFEMFWKLIVNNTLKWFHKLLL